MPTTRKPTCESRPGWRSWTRCPGKVATEGEITDLVGWAVTGQLRRNNPGRSLFVDLNEDASGVDVVDAMGKKQPATLAVPFELYDIKSLHAEEGPAPGGLTFGLAVDPLNPEAIKRQKADLPMLDVYTADATSGTVKLPGTGLHPPPRHLADARGQAGRAQALQEFLSRRR